MELTREVVDVTPANRDSIERALFAGLCRHFCDEHGRYSVDRFTMKRSRGKTTAHVTMCCYGDDDHLPWVVDAAPSMALEHREELLEMTKVPPGAAYDLQAWVAMGLWRRRRGEQMTLEATLCLKGDDRPTEQQAARLQALIEDAIAARKLVCTKHGRAIQQTFIGKEGEALTLDAALCCPKASGVMRDVNALVDKALLSGPVVKIAAGKHLPERGARKPPRR